MRAAAGPSSLWIGTRVKIGNSEFRVECVTLGTQPAEQKLRLSDASNKRRFTHIIGDELYEPQAPTTVAAHATARDEFLRSLRKQRGGYRSDWSAYLLTA